MTIKFGEFLVDERGFRIEDVEEEDEILIVPISPPPCRHPRRGEEGGDNEMSCLFTHPPTPI